MKRKRMRMRLDPCQYVEPWISMNIQHIVRRRPPVILDVQVSSSTLEFLLLLYCCCCFLDLSEHGNSGCKSDESSRSIGKVHCDTVLNFLIRLACQVTDNQPTLLNSGDNLSRR